MTASELLSKVKRTIKRCISTLQCCLISSTYLFDKCFFTISSIYHTRGRISVYLKSCYGQRCKTFLFSQEDIKQILPHIDRDALLRDADLLKDHIVDILGSGKCKLESRINWHKDFKSSKEWPLLFYKRLPIVFPDNSDIKVVWEISRFHHFVIFGIAYKLTGTPQFKDEFEVQTKDWIKQNPVCFGPNWCVAMEAAIRAINLIVSYFFFFSESKPGFWFGYELNLFLHGTYIYRNLEKRFDEKGNEVNNNHYLSDLVGLLFLGHFFSHTSAGKMWKDFARKEFFKEIDKQILEDGGDFESSSGYQRLVTELISCGLLLLLNEKEDIPATVIERWRKMFEFICHLTKPDGRITTYGDDDDGRVLVFNNYFDWDRSKLDYLLGIGTTVFGDQYASYEATGGEAEELWLTHGLSRKNRLPLTHDVRQISKKSIALPQSGFYVMRHKQHYMLVTAPPVRRHGHNHNDLFGFEIFVNGQSVIVDPGSYMYTGNEDLRNLFRSTRYHNTVHVNDLEINRFRGTCFGLMNDSNPLVEQWSSQKDHDIFVGLHRGFSENEYPVEHRRKIYFAKNEQPFWVIFDEIGTSCNNVKFPISVKQYFHLTGDLVITQVSQQPIVRATLDKLRVIYPDDIPNTSVLDVSINRDGAPSFFIQQWLTNDLRFCEERGWISPSYGRRNEAPICVFEKYGVPPICFLTSVACSALKQSAD